MNKPYTHILICCLSITYFGCTEKTKNFSKKIILKDSSYQIVNNETTDSNNLNEYINKIKLKKSSVIGNFEVKYGYLEYDEDKNGWENLGFLEVYKNLKLIYQEKFKGYDELFIHNLGHHLLYENKIIFKLDYGTEACDYAHSSRYYYISENDSIGFIGEFDNTSTDYATRYFELFFPEDSGGIPNKMILVEGLHYKENNKPNVRDTTIYEFKAHGFTVAKLSNNLNSTN